MQRSGLERKGGPVAIRAWALARGELLESRTESAPELPGGRHRVWVAASRIWRVAQDGQAEKLGERLSESLVDATSAEESVSLSFRE